MWRPTTSPTCAWAFCIGFRNLLAGIGTIVGLVILWTGDEAVGRAVVVTALCYMLLASLAMGIADLLGLGDPARKRARHPRIQPAAAGRPRPRGLLTRIFLRSATSLRSGWLLQSGDGDGASGSRMNSSHAAASGGCGGARGRAPH